LSNDADFVIHCGDISNEGLSKEYEFTWDIMDGIRLPYLTVIGNHDLVANGRSIYKKMFGEENYTYVYKNCKFVFFDDNVWENTVKDPDFEWMEKELSDTLGQYTHVFLVCHVPYTDEMFFPTQKHAFKNIIEKSTVNLCIQGHRHHPEIIRDTVNENRIITYLITGSVHDRQLRRLDIKQDTVIINDIKF
ncbi:MAG: metallophosphoesterase family protein, partial [Bacteroidales bacterium]|nr:metallophosphoesterase family protein [Bacteroidales bacterium]